MDAAAAATCAPQYWHCSSTGRCTATMIQKSTSAVTAWKPSPGPVYPTLQMLGDEGLITATETDRGKSFSS